MPMTYILPVCPLEGNHDVLYGAHECWACELIRFAHDVAYDVRPDLEMFQERALDMFDGVIETREVTR